MSSSAIEQQHVLAAISEYERLGRTEFLRHYRFGDARSVFLIHDGRSYEAKAIVGVANGYATGVFVSGGDPDYKAGQARSVLRRLGMTVTDQPPPASPAPEPGMPRLRAIPLEQNVTERYPVQPSPDAPSERERSEGRLVAAYAGFLRSLGHTVCRHTIALEDQLLVTDLFDETAGELIEAKSSTDRGAIRYALGQILDYARYVEPDVMAVLLPDRPSADLCGLLTSNGVDVIWQDDERFEREGSAVR